MKHRHLDVLIIGAGVSGQNAANIALGMGADVTLLDTDLDKLRMSFWRYNNRVHGLASSKLAIEQQVMEADLVIGSRVLGEREPGALLPQARAGNLVACLLIRLLYGHRYTDLGPFRAARWEALERLGMSDPDFGWTAEMQVKALRHGLRVTEVPVSYRKRVGVSKITGTIVGTFRAGYKILWTVLRYSRG